MLMAMTSRGTQGHPTQERWIVAWTLGETLRNRLGAAGASLACLVLLAFAARLHPNESGLGTHEQVGLGPCLAPILTGYPCPTCGMTTAVAHAVRGQWIMGFQAQPAGLALAITVAAVALMGGWGAITGRTWRLNPLIFSLDRMAVAAVAIWLLGWGYKVASGQLNGTLPLW